MSKFIHLHVHSQYSILDGACPVDELIEKAIGFGMDALAVTDHGNMFGAKYFYNKARSKKIKPIIGIETYVARNNRFNKSAKEDRSGDHLILLAKNLTGYKNLLKLSSFAYTEGFYYKPRIDKELLNLYHEGLIASTACLGGEIPRHIMNNRMDEAEKAIAWYKERFGDDFYLEIMRHKSGIPQIDSEVYNYQQLIIPHIKSLAEKFQVKIIATNDVHYIGSDDAAAHKLLIKINTNSDNDDQTSLKYTGQEYFKSPDEMESLFSDIPEAVTNTVEIAQKIENYELDSPPIMPDFPIPEDFIPDIDPLKTSVINAIHRKTAALNQRPEFEQAEKEARAFIEKINDFTTIPQIQSLLDGESPWLGKLPEIFQVCLQLLYLKHLTYDGAIKRYTVIDDELKERINFELETIEKMGFPGYFLIVQDFIRMARKMGVIVGPGRGSAAGSVVAYCTYITNIDPLRYNLLFERFLNPDRISMPDIDIDFDDEGRDKVLKWVTEKYGADKVAQIITFGSMAARMAIRDVARLYDYPPAAINQLSKLVPEGPNIKLKQAVQEVTKLKEMKNGSDKKAADVIRFAEKLEGSIRNTGTHACGVIISRDELWEHIPICTSKDAKLLVTQYEGEFVEAVGMLKMDFLGLKTLTILKSTLDNIRQSKGIDIDIDQLPLDDEKTYQIYGRGETTALFQFESPGMKKHLKALQPNRFEDLVAMNALYRPGPMAYIPSYIHRKHGKEKIEYDHPMMEPYLKETYGITVYQEQVMLLSRALAGFSRGDSDKLRKAMGKKKREEMDKLKIKFTEGCKNNPRFTEGCEKMKINPEKLCDKIWKDWEAFAEYAFNKSHSVCYAYLSYQTAWMKAHYPSEFMAGVLSNNISDISKISEFMDECRRMGIKVLGPDVNESFAGFMVNKKGDIRFGLNAIKGVGEAAVQSIIAARQTGEFTSIFDFVARVDLRTVNKRTMEALAMAGAFDTFSEISRSQYFVPNKDGNFIETLIKFGNRLQTDLQRATATLFGDFEPIEIAKPAIPVITNEWSRTERLDKERELVGMYISEHPLDEYKTLIQHLCNIKVSDLNNLMEIEPGEVIFAAFITLVTDRKTQKNNDYCQVSFEDYSGSHTMNVFSKEFDSFRKFFNPGALLLMRGKIQPRPTDPDLLEMRLTSVSPLPDAAAKILKLELHMAMQIIDEELIFQLNNIVENNKGTVMLHFTVFDQENGFELKLSSRTHRVKVSDTLLRFLDEHPEIEYHLQL